MPINEPRRYVVRVFSQDNFLFEPESRILDLEEKSDVEIKRFIEQTDSSFKFIGFSLRGQLFSQNSKDSLGPKGIKIGLYDFKDKFLSETTSVEGGVFSFDKLQAGNYSIIALENNIEVLGYSLSKNERRMKCEVSWGKPYNCQGRIVIHGYTYKGFVLNEETPLANFFLFLYETTPNNNPNYPCTKPEMKTHPLIQKYPRYLCYSISDQEGAFVFSDLSNGDYILSIKPLQDDKKVEIEPHEVPLVIRHSAKTEKLQFQVNRFSIEGRVVDTQGLGLAHVVISLDGEEKTKTNEKGYYSLEKVRSGTYTLEGLHDHLFFEPIHDLKLSVGLKQIPNLVLTYLHVCGKVFYIEKLKKIKFLIYF